MKDAHLSIETLASWLAGDLDHETLLRDVVPHFLEHCTECRQRYQEILSLQRQFGHWDERVAVFEGLQAPELFATIKGLPFDEQLSRIADDPSYQTWGFCQMLLKESVEAAFEDAGRAMNLADLAIHVVQNLGTVYDPHWVLDLHAKCHAYLGNARRVFGELRSAETSFRKAETLLALSMTGNSLVRAEFLHLKCSLWRNLRRLDEALELADEALSLYQENQDPYGIGMVRLNKAKVLEEVGNLPAAILLLQEAIAELNPAEAPQLALYARHNLITCLSENGQFLEASRLLPESRTLFERNAKPLDLVRLRWTEGKVAFGLGEIQQAEFHFREVQQEFLRRTMGFDAALVSLDLAVLLAQQGRYQELKQLALEVIPVFEAQDVHREAMAALLIFQKACNEETLTAELARQIASALEKSRQAGKR